MLPIKFTISERKKNIDADWRKYLVFSHVRTSCTSAILFFFLFKEWIKHVGPIQLVSKCYEIPEQWLNGTITLIIDQMLILDIFEF